MPGPIFKGAFPGGFQEEFSGLGKRPVIFDILGPDRSTSILPDGMKLVLHVNPKSMSVKYQKVVERIQTKGGFVEQHWGDGPQSIDFDHATGGFMRLYSGLVSSTSPQETGGSRRQTLAYDSFLDMLATFHNNGSVYDINNQAVLQGIIKITFDGGVYLGWFKDSFSVSESAEGPYQFSITTSFEVAHEIQTWRTAQDPSLSLIPGVSDGS